MIIGILTTAGTIAIVYNVVKNFFNKKAGKITGTVTMIKSTLKTFIGIAAMGIAGALFYSIIF